MLIDEIREKKQEIEALARQFGARRIRIFGSVARGAENRTSDIDFLVDFPSGYDLFEQRLPLAEKLSELLLREVELIPEHEVNRHLLNHVMAEAVDL